MFPIISHIISLYIPLYSHSVYSYVSSPFRSPRPRVLLGHFQGSLRAAAAASPRGRAGIAAGAGPATAQEAADGSVLGMPWGTAEWRLRDIDIDISYIGKPKP